MSKAIRVYAIHGPGTEVLRNVNPYITDLMPLEQRLLDYLEPINKVLDREPPAALNIVAIPGKGWDSYKALDLVLALLHKGSNVLVVTTTSPQFVDNLIERCEYAEMTNPSVCGALGLLANRDHSVTEFGIPEIVAATVNRAAKVIHDFHVFNDLDLTVKESVRDIVSRVVAEGATEYDRWYFNAFSKGT